MIGDCELGLGALCRKDLGSTVACFFSRRLSVVLSGKLKMQRDFCTSAAPYQLPRSSTRTRRR